MKTACKFLALVVLMFPLFGNTTCEFNVNLPTYVNSGYYPPGVNGWGYYGRYRILYDEWGYPYYERYDPYRRKTVIIYYYPKHNCKYNCSGWSEQKPSTPHEYCRTKEQQQKHWDQQGDKGHRGNGPSSIQQNWHGQDGFVVQGSTVAVPQPQGGVYGVPGGSRGHKNTNKDAVRAQKRWEKQRKQEKKNYR